MRHQRARPVRWSWLTTICLSALAGCAAPRSPLPATEQVLASLEPAYTGEKITGCLATPLPRQRDCRDAVVQSLMVAIDLRYAEFEVAFFETNRSLGFAATLATLGLGAAGAVVPGSTSQILSAISAGITGSREAFGREVMMEQTATALLTAMRAQRNAVGVRLRLGLGEEATRYPLGVALSDLYDYFRAGTLPGALAGLTQLVGVQADVTQQQLRAATVGQGLATTPLASRLRGYLDAPGITAAQRDQRMSELIAAVDAEGLGAIGVASLLRNDTPEGEERRARLARRLGLMP